MDFLDSKDFYYKMALVTLVVVFLELVLGSYVKSIGAGLSCPDWPLCYGQIIPLNSADFQHYSFRDVWAEYLHRVTASVVSILLVFLAFLTFKHRDELTEHKHQIGMKRFQIMALILVLLVLQVIMGGLTVILDTNPEIVTTHLAIAALIFGLTVFLTTKIAPQEG